MPHAKFIRRRLRPIATALLLAMAFVQLAEFAHQSEHTVADTAERCAICVQLDQFGNAVSSPAAAANVDYSAVAASLPSGRLVAKASIARPSARAPPLS